MNLWKIFPFYASLLRGPSPLALIIFFSAIVASATTDQSHNERGSPSDVREIVVFGKDQTPGSQATDQIIPMTRIPLQSLERKRPSSFSDALNGGKGIDSQMACSFCGSKRISINGFKGEHTTILIDDLPLHSSISTFYGVDTIPLGGIDSIEIYRGSGMALMTPESIGGAINIITREVTGNDLESRLSISQDNQSDISLLVTRKVTDHTGLLVGLQGTQSQPLDLDHNNISEVPDQKMGSFFGKIQHQFTDHDSLHFRFSHARRETIGGTMDSLRLEEPVSSVVRSDAFPNSDVREPYLGDPKAITDNVSVVRNEVALRSENRISEYLFLKTAAGLAQQNLETIYSHGYDYDNDDDLWAARTELQMAHFENHLIQVGIDTKQQTMSSSSQTLYTIQSLRKDDLHSRSSGFFIFDNWTASDRTAISLGTRFDLLSTQWTDLDKKIEHATLNPRISIKHQHSEILTSRFSFGTATRSPLTIFESMHGTDHEGFEIDIDRPERGISYLYALNGQRLDDFFETNIQITDIENMAYGRDRALWGQSTLFENSKDTYRLRIFDLSYGRRISPTWSIEGTFEAFDLPGKYKRLLPVAAIERRLSVSSDLAWGPWTISQKLQVIGERGLRAYGHYDDHYHIVRLDDDVTSPTFNELIASSPKFRKAPTFLTVDLSFERSLSESLSLGLSVLNLFDYTQTRAGDSPTTWHLHGSEYHLDSFHLWGPLRGRQVFLTLKGSL